MPAPRIADFSLPATGGATFTPSNLRGRPFVVYFYPKDNTPGCTVEAQQFRDLHDRFARRDCAIYGISRDSIRAHEGFRMKLDLPFALVSDPDEIACGAFGVIRMKKLYGKDVRGIERSTFVVGADGTILREWRGVKAPGHAQEVLAFVESI